MSEFIHNCSVDIEMPWKKPWGLQLTYCISAFIQGRPEDNLYTQRTLELC